MLVQRQAKISSSKNEQQFNQAKEKLLAAFQKLKKKCEDESGTGFFYGSCIGLDADKSNFSDRIKSTFRRLASELGHYVKQVEKST
jgi:glutathionylspermidine synthase